MSFKIDDDNVLVRYNEVCGKTLKILNIKFHSQRIYDEIYIKTKAKTFNDVVNKFPKEIIHYICITAIGIDSVMKIDKKTYAQV